MATEKTIPATPEERDLMERLRDALDRCDSRAINRLIDEVYAHVERTLRGVTRTYPDSEAAVWAALEQITSRGGVRLWLATWTAGLKTYAATVARRSRHALDAGLIGEKAKGDAMYSTRSTSLDALIEMHGDRMKGAKTLDQLDAEQRRETRVVREGFTRISGSLTDKQRAAVLRYANLHVDAIRTGLAEHEESAISLRIARSVFDRRLDAAARKVEKDAVFQDRLAALCDVETSRVQRAALANQERRKAAAAAAEKRAAERARAASKREALVA